MCTLSVFTHQDQTIITMNRDEQRERHEDGALYTKGGHCFPVDSASRGTWVGTNQHGLTLALLNRYQDEHIQGPAQSRGSIIPMLLSCTSLDEVKQQMQKLTVNRFNPFDCLAVCDGVIIQATWNGEKLNIAQHILDKAFFITSSSERTAEVIQFRHNVFSEFLTQSVSAHNILQNLHLKGGNDNNDSSIMMSREHTHTKSITQITLTQKNAEVLYWTEASLAQGPEGLKDRAIKHLLPLTSTTKNAPA